MPRPTTYRALGNFLRRHDEKRYAYRNLLSAEYRDSLSSTRLVSSRGLLELCDIHADAPQSSVVNQKYLATIPAQLKSFSTANRVPSIYLCTDAITFFVRNVLPQIDQPFILISGDSDLSVSHATITDLDELLKNHYLKQWFAQNLECVHPRLEPLPIGLDFHTVWHSPGHFGGGPILPMQQEAEIRKIVRTALPFSQREPLAFCDWLNGAAYGDRADAKSGIAEIARVSPSGRLPRYALWQECAQHAFVASPFGIGIDCHRTWEALALGCVPIVKKTKMASIFDGLPVLIVDSWEQITPDYLEREQLRMASLDFNYAGLFLNFWAQRIKMSSSLQIVNARVDQISLLI